MVKGKERDSKQAQAKSRSEPLKEWTEKCTQSRCFCVARYCDSEQRKNKKLTVSHSHSQRGVVKLDIVDPQHVHEELQPKSARHIT